MGFPGPADNFHYTVSGPEGIERIVVVATTRPVNLNAQDLATFAGEKDLFPVAPAAKAPALWKGVQDALHDPAIWTSAEFTFQIGQDVIVEERQTQQQSALPPPPPAWAVVIGISQYAPRLSNLQYPDADARLVSQLLQEKLGVPGDHLRLLLNSEATVANVEATVDWVAQRAQTGDRAYLFFSGHSGYQDKATGGGKFLCLYDANLVDYDWYRDVHRIKCAQLIEFRDDSYGRDAPPGFLSRLHRLGGCQPDQGGQEDNELRHGVFTYFLARGLRGGACVKGSSRITLQQLADYVTIRTSQYTNGYQVPMLDPSGPDADLVLIP
jgi:hypothetical protein